MRLLPLTKGHNAIVSDQDYELVSLFKWQAQVTNNGVYVRRKMLRAEGRPSGVFKSVFLHRFIMNAPDGMEVDHINGNPLDNRRENLRLCIHAQNQGNRVIGKNNKSGYKGVSYCLKNGMWYASIKLKGISKNLGYYKTAAEASEAYNAAAKQSFGEFASQRKAG